MEHQSPQQRRQRRQIVSIGPPPPTITYHYPAPVQHYPAHPPPPYPPHQYPMQPYYPAYPQYAYPPTGQYVISQYNPNLMNQQVDDDQLSRGGRYRRRSAKPGKSIFPQKLWRLVNNQQLSSAIKWSDDGLSFFVYESPLTNMCLGKENNLFHTKQPKSFIRQLHLYGFRKVNKSQFMHRFFVRGRPDQVRFIRRSYRQPTGSTSSDKSENSTDNEVAKQLEKQSTAKKNSDNPCSSSAANQGENQISNVEKDAGEGKCSSCSTREDELSNQFPSQTIHEQKEQQSILEIESQVCDQAADTFAASSNAAVAISNDYDMNCTAQVDWYGNNYADNSYSYNGESILNFYENEGYPNPYDNDNITM